MQKSNTEIRNESKEDLEKLEEILESVKELEEDLNQIVDDNEEFIKAALGNNMEELNQGIQELSNFIANTKIQNLYSIQLPKVAYYNPELFTK